MAGWATVEVSAWVSEVVSGGALLFIATKTTTSSSPTLKPLSLAPIPTSWLKSIFNHTNCQHPLTQNNREPHHTLHHGHFQCHNSSMRPPTTTHQNRHSGSTTNAPTSGYQRAPDTLPRPHCSMVSYSTIQGPEESSKCSIYTTTATATSSAKNASFSTPPINTKQMDAIPPISCQLPPFFSIPVASPPISIPLSSPLLQFVSAWDRSYITKSPKHLCHLCPHCHLWSCQCWWRWKCWRWGRRDWVNISLFKLSWRVAIVAQFLCYPALVLVLWLGTILECG